MHVPNVDARYTNLQRVGTGGFGVVYRAHDVRLDRDVAIKFLNPELASDPTWRHRFRQEATAASQLNHPNITIVFDRSDDEHQPYIVMEFVDGKPLSKIIEEGVPLADPERLLLIEQLCAGLQYAHQRQIVHRDIKPVNLMVREERDGAHIARTLKILDFGIAKVVNASQTMTVGPLMFTPNYVSPEQIQGFEADHRSDIFAVGAVAYELLVQQKAFVISSKNQFQFLEEVKRKIVDEPHTPMTEVRSDVDPELVTIVDRALAKDPDARYRDLGEMRRKVRIVRERLEAALEAVNSQATVIIDPRPHQAIRRARQLLTADDPEGAVTLLEEALTFTPNPSIRVLVDELLGLAREQQRVKRTREAQAARSAVAIATATFQQGDTAAAIEGLERFEPRSLVVEQLALLQRAAALVAATERAVNEGARAARDAALRELEAFVPLDLVAPAAQELRSIASGRDEREHQEEQAAAAAAQAAIASARDAFRGGARADAIQALERFENRTRVLHDLNQLRNASREIDRAAAGIRAGDRGVRARALADLAAFADPDLVAAALGELRSADAARQATEDHESAAAALIQSARDRFEHGDRSGALQQLEQFTPRHPAVSAALTTLQARAAELGLAEREERAARELIDTADTDFRNGRRAAAIAALEAHRAWPLVSNALDALSRADRALARAERATAQGDAAARSAALDDLVRFQPADLVAAEIPALRKRAEERDEEERELAKAQGRAAWEERARVAVRHAQEAFSAGRRDEALDRLQRFPQPELVATALIELQRLAALVAGVEHRVRTGAPEDRRVALDELVAAGPAPLLEGAIVALRARDAERTAEEQQREEEARAVQAVTEATALFDEGRHVDAISMLEGYAPPSPRITDALTALRDKRAQLEAERERAALVQEAEATEARARAEFSAGHVAEALAILSAFREPAVVASAFDALRRASQAIAKARESVTNEPAPVRRAAIARIDGLAPSDLYQVALAELRRIDEDRSADEARKEAARLAAEAERCAKAARAQFLRGEQEAAIQTLERFQPIALVDASLAELRAAHQAIGRAQRLAETGDDQTREEAIDTLRRFDPLDLVALSIERLREDHLQRRAAEEQARIELEVRERAERTADEARRAFDAGQIKGALGLLERFEPSHPVVTELLTELRITLSVRDLVARAEESLAASRFADARAAMGEARRARPDDPVIEQLDRRIRSQQRAARLQLARHLAVRVVGPATIVVAVIIAGYLFWPVNPSTSPTEKQRQQQDKARGETGKPQSHEISRANDDRERLVKEIRDLAATGKLEDAAKRIEEVRNGPQDPAMEEAAKDVLARAEERMAAAKKEAVRAAAEGQPSFAGGAEYEVRARNQTESQQIVDAVNSFGTAEKLFGQAIQSRLGVVRVIDGIRRSLTEHRLADAADQIVRALAATPGDGTVSALARDVLARAQQASGAAKKQALDTGAQQQPAFKDALSREQTAQGLSEPQQLAQAVRSYQQATSLYVEATKAQRRFAIQTEKIQGIVAQIQGLVRAGKLSDAAAQIVRALPDSQSDQRVATLAQDVATRAREGTAAARKEAADAGAQNQDAFIKALGQERAASGLSRPEQVAQAVDAYDKAASMFREAVRVQRLTQTGKPEGGKSTQTRNTEKSGEASASGTDLRAEQAAIAQLLTDYARAYERIDQDAVRRIDPTFRGFSAQERALLKSVRVSFSGVNIQFAPDGRSAKLSATQNFEYEWKRAGLGRTSSGTINWSLAKLRDGWTVVR